MFKHYEGQARDHILKLCLELCKKVKSQSPMEYQQSFNSKWTFDLYLCYAIAPKSYACGVAKCIVEFCFLKLKDIELITSLDMMMMHYCWIG